MTTRALLTAGAAALACSTATAASAQAVDEILVTAQKRTERLQDVPLAVTAVTGATIEATRTRDILDLSDRTPNLVVTAFNVAEPRYAIRGIGSTSDSAASDPSVAVFVDEVYYGRPAISNFTLFDVERVEVLRGPQGTLFGRNTSGGAIHVITARPELGRGSARLLVGAGDYGSYEARVMANAGGREAAVRLSASYAGHGPYSRNIATGAGLDFRNALSARAALLWEPDDRVRAIASLDFGDDDNGGNARIPLPVFETTPVGRLIRTLRPAGTDPRLSSSDPRTFQKRTVWGATLRVEAELGFADLVSVSSYREADVDQHEDLDGLKPLPPWILVNQNFVNEESRQWSQEVRLASPQDSSFAWVAGVFLFEEQVDRAERFFTRFLPLPPAGGDVTFLQDVTSRSSAVFAQVSAPLGGGFQLTGGLRYTWDKKRAISSALNNDPTDPTPGIPLFPGQTYRNIEGRGDWGRLTGRGAIEFRSGGQLFFLSASRGYKSGVFPSQSNVVADLVNPLPPEEVWAYEAGARLSVLADRLRLAAIGFVLDYKDLQQFFLNQQLLLVTFNVDADIKGVEVEADARPADWLTLGATYGFLDTRISGRPVSGIDLDGNRLGQAPRHSLSLYGVAEVPLGGGRLSLRGDASWRDSFFTEASNRPETFVSSYWLLNARAAYRFARDRFELAVWGRNLSNEVVPLHVIPFQNNGFSILAPPRTWGVTLGVRMP
jgi:iron complex outermembrane receptor protein